MKFSWEGSSTSICHDNDGNLYVGSRRNVTVFNEIHEVVQTHSEYREVSSIEIHNQNIYMAYISQSLETSPKLQTTRLGRPPAPAKTTVANLKVSEFSKKLEMDKVICSVGGVKRLTAAGNCLVALTSTVRQLYMIDTKSMLKKRIEFDSSTCIEDVKLLKANCLLILLQQTLVSYDIRRSMVIWRVELPTSLGTASLMCLAYQSYILILGEGNRIESSIAIVSMSGRVPIPYHRVSRLSVGGNKDATFFLIGQLLTNIKLRTDSTSKPTGMSMHDRELVISFEDKRFVYRVK